MILSLKPGQPVAFERHDEWVVGTFVRMGRRDEQLKRMALASIETVDAAIVERDGEQVASAGHALERAGGPGPREKDLPPIKQVR